MESNMTMTPEPSGPRLSLFVTSGPHEQSRFQITSFPVTIGRRSPNTIILDKDRWVSSKHCEIFSQGNNYYVKDLGSANGTYVNGKEIHEQTPLVPSKSSVAVGKSVIAFIDESQFQVEDKAMQTLSINNLISSGLLPSATGGFFDHERDESLFVVDICNSTSYGNFYGEKALFGVLMEIAKSITRYNELDCILYLQHTGDGFFATFDQTQHALGIACGLLADMKNYKSSHPEVAYPGIRIAIHRGNVVPNISGDRMGIACHLTFRIEGAKIEDRVGSAEGVCELPERDRILITNEAINSLDVEISDLIHHVGEFKFKGFDDPIRLNLVTGEPGAVLEKIQP